MKQYRVTYTVDKGDGDDCVLDPNDPLYKMKEDMFPNIPRGRRL